MDITFTVNEFSSNNFFVKKKKKNLRQIFSFDYFFDDQK